MQQLAGLDAYQPQQHLSHLPIDILQIATPLQLQIWEDLLQGYPDQKFAQYIVSGLRNGFRIGFNQEARLKAGTHNMLSVT